MHTGMAHRLSALKGGEGVVAPRLWDRLWAADSGGWSSAIADRVVLAPRVIRIFATPPYPSEAAKRSGVWLPLSALSGLTSSRLSSIFTTASAYSHLKEPTRVVLGRCCRVHQGG